MNERAGHYQTQPTGYKAFTPQNLPPYPALVIGENLKKLLVLTEQKLAELNGIGFSLPNPDLFIVMVIRKEALLSSQLKAHKQQ